MSVWKLLWLLVLWREICGDIDSKEHFCGRKLMQTLNELCSLFYSNSHPSRNRFRRRIVDECCHSQCSRRYLIEYYCLEANSAVLNFINPSEENKITTEPPLDKHLIAVGSTASTNSISLPNQIIHKKKRCKCRKRRSKKLLKVKVPPAVIGRIEESGTPFYVFPKRY